MSEVGLISIDWVKHLPDTISQEVSYLSDTLLISKGHVAFAKFNQEKINLQIV